MPRIDMGDVKSFETVEAGKYHVLFTGHKASVSKAGNDKERLTFTIASGPKEGVMVGDDYSLVPAALFKLKQAGIAMGGDPDVWKGSFDTTEELDILVGWEGEIVVTKEEYPEGSGQYRNHIAQVIASD